VSWNYDESSSQVTTTFKVTTAVREGADNGTLLGLFPHQWFKNPILPPTLAYDYPTIRGKMKLIAGKQFQTRYRYNGILPVWPRLTEAAQVERMNKYFDWEAGEGIQFGANNGPYWTGKALGRTAQMLSITETQGDKARTDLLLRLIKQPLEKWFKIDPKPQQYFYYDKKNGSLIAYPTEFGAAKQLNDHYFHYSYWVLAAAHIALRDPQWAAKNKWGGMIDLLIRDFASTDRNDPMFPYLRHFDAYEGHSWASGIVQFSDGNNQESSSEAINAWSAMILWGEITGNKQIRDAGIYMYTTEIQAINHYWFDLNKMVFAPEYSNVEVSIVWGGKYEHRTWWTNEPRQIHGINLLPLTGASLYLGTDPNFVKLNMDTMEKEHIKYKDFDKKVKDDTWQDILLSYYAFYDPVTALAKWDDSGALENGETRGHTYYWIQTLANLGRPDFSITADTPLYSVFRKGDKVTHAAYNATSQPKKVTFSDGTVLNVAPRSLASDEAK
jgi:endoglucanase Acf2